MQGTTATKDDSRKSDLDSGMQGYFFLGWARLVGERNAGEGRWGMTSRLSSSLLVKVWPVDPHMRTQYREPNGHPHLVLRGGGIQAGDKTHQSWYPQSQDWIKSQDTQTRERSVGVRTLNSGPSPCQRSAGFPHKGGDTAPVAAEPAAPQTLPCRLRTGGVGARGFLWLR